MPPSVFFFLLLLNVLQSVGKKVLLKLLVFFNVYQELFSFLTPNLLSLSFSFSLLFLSSLILMNSSSKNPPNSGPSS